MRSEPAAVTSGGLTWSVHSRNERAITHAGRHFFAVRCRSGLPWKLIELDRSIDEGSARELRRTLSGYETAELSDAVRRFCGDPGRTPWLCPACYVVNQADAVTCGACAGAVDPVFPVMGPRA